MNLKVYRNSLNQKWSMLYKNKVVGHADEVLLSQVRFNISEGKRLESIRLHKKTQNASATGIIQNVVNFSPVANFILPKPVISNSIDLNNLEEVKYNPSIQNYFFTKNNLRVDSCNLAHFNSIGKSYIHRYSMLKRKDVKITDRHIKTAQENLLSQDYRPKIKKFAVLAARENQLGFCLPKDLICEAYRIAGVELKPHEFSGGDEANNFLRKFGCIIIDLNTVAVESLSDAEILDAALKMQSQLSVEEVYNFFITQTKEMLNKANLKNPMSLRNQLIGDGLI
jgi:hypothetical protein